MISPYDGTPHSEWKEITRQLVASHPLQTSIVVEIVLKAWAEIFDSKLGLKPYLIGVDIIPKPQIMGFLLEEFTVLDLAGKYPDEWRAGQTATEKDLIYKADDQFSVEKKFSSSGKHIYGNRSYAQTSATGRAKKNKSGYYLTVNFQKFTLGTSRPAITQIRFGWLDHSDWQGQASSTGQQARLSNTVEDSKLLVLYNLQT